MNNRSAAAAAAAAAARLLIRQTKKYNADIEEAHRCAVQQGKLQYDSCYCFWNNWHRVHADVAKCNAGEN